MAKIEKKNFWFHYIVAQKFLTMPAQWSQKVGVKYVVSWKLCEKPLLSSWQFAFMK